MSLSGNPQQDMGDMMLNPEKYGEAVIASHTPTDLAKMMAQSGIDPNSALGHQIMQANIAKQNYIAPAQARPGGYTQDPTTGAWTYHAALPQGSQPTMAPDGSVASVAPIPGAAQVESVMAGAKAGATSAAQAPYDLITVTDPQSGRTYQIPKSSITGGAGGAAAPSGGGLNGYYRGASGAPAGAPAGLGASETSSLTTAGKNSADAFQSAIDGGNNAKNSIRLIDNIMTAANGLQTGTGADAMSQVKSFGNSVLGQVGIHPFDTRDIAKFDEIRKNAAQLGDQLSASVGGGTDARLKNALDGLPTAHYSPQAIQEVGTNLKALQTAALGRAQAASAWLQTHKPDSYPEFQQAWQKAYDPDLFYYMQKGPDAFAGWVKGAGLVLGGLAFFIRAGDKTPDNIKAISANMSANAGEKPTGAATDPSLKPVSDVIGSTLGGAK
jgi:hypothetical protein